MVVGHIPDEVAREVAEDIGTDDPQEVVEALCLLWQELGNPVEMIEDVREEVPAE